MYRKYIRLIDVKVQEIQKDIGKEITYIKEEVTNVKEECADLKGEFSVMKEEFSEKLSAVEGELHQ